MKGIWFKFWKSDRNRIWKAFESQVEIEAPVWSEKSAVVHWHIFPAKTNVFKTTKTFSNNRIIPQRSVSTMHIGNVKCESEQKKRVGGWKRFHRVERRQLPRYLTPLHPNLILDGAAQHSKWHFISISGRQTSQRPSTRDKAPFLPLLVFDFNQNPASCFQFQFLELVWIKWFPCGMRWG